MCSPEDTLILNDKERKLNNHPYLLQHVVLTKASFSQEEDRLRWSTSLACEANSDEADVSCKITQNAVNSDSINKIILYHTYTPCLHT